VIQPSGFHFAIVDLRICGEPISFDAAPGFIGRVGFYISESQRQRNMRFRIFGSADTLALVISIAGGQARCWLRQFYDGNKL
jgi:hypothetical protein